MSPCHSEVIKRLAIFANLTARAQIMRYSVESFVYT